MDLDGALAIVPPAPILDAEIPALLPPWVALASSKARVVTRPSARAKTGHLRLRLRKALDRGDYDEVARLTGELKALVS